MLFPPCASDFCGVSEAPIFLEYCGFTFKAKTSSECNECLLLEGAWMDDHKLLDMIGRESNFDRKYLTLYQGDKIIEFQRLEDLKNI